jgi:hypothetical protein
MRATVCIGDPGILLIVRRGDRIAYPLDSNSLLVHHVNRHEVSSRLAGELRGHYRWFGGGAPQIASRHDTQH